MLLSAKSETKLPLQPQLSGRGLQAALGAQLETTAWPPVHTHTHRHGGLTGAGAAEGPKAKGKERTTCGG